MELLIDNPDLSFVGSVTKQHMNSIGCKMFTVRLTVYADKDANENRIYTRFHVHCVMPATERWKNVPVPRFGSDVQITGELIGFCTMDNRQAICVFVSQLLYLFIMSHVVDDPFRRAPKTPLSVK